LFREFPGFCEATDELNEVFIAFMNEPIQFFMVNDEANEVFTIFFNGFTQLCETIDEVVIASIC
jgi:hypothetical protein